MIGLIALDFDYTLIDYLPGQKAHIEPEALNLFNRLSASGIRMGIVTGRNFEGFPQTFNEVGGTWGDPFPGFLIALDSYLYEKNAQGEFQADEEENKKVQQRILQRVQEMLPYFPDCLKRLQENEIPIRSWAIGGEHGLTVETDTFLSAQKALELMEGKIPGALCARNYHLFHITPLGEGKGASVLRYAQKLGLRPDEVLAIGDSLNDLTMLDGTLGFHSACVANADERVKAAVTRNQGMVSQFRASRGTADCILHFLREQDWE